MAARCADGTDTHHGVVPTRHGAVGWVHVADICGSALEVATCYLPHSPSDNGDTLLCNMKTLILTGG